MIDKFFHSIGIGIHAVGLGCPLFHLEEYWYIQTEYFEMIVKDLGQNACRTTKRMKSFTKTYDDIPITNFQTKQHLFVTEYVQNNRKHHIENIQRLARWHTIRQVSRNCIDGFPGKSSHGKFAIASKFN